MYVFLAVFRMGLDHRGQPAWHRHFITCADAAKALALIKSAFPPAEEITISQVGEAGNYFNGGNRG